MDRPRGRERVPVTLAALSEVALAYLNRVPASKQALARKLESWVEARGEPPDLTSARPLIGALIERYEQSRLLDDARLAENLRGSSRARGQSRRAIQQRLYQRGLGSDAISEVLDQERRQGGDAELLAAQALVRRRKLGPYRPEAERAAHRQRDLGVLSRAGFDREVALRALAAHDEDEF